MRCYGEDGSTVKNLGPEAKPEGLSFVQEV